MITLKELEALREKALANEAFWDVVDRELHDAFPALLSSWRAMREVLDGMNSHANCPECLEDLDINQPVGLDHHASDCPLAAALAQARELEG